MFTQSAIKFVNCLKTEVKASPPYKIKNAGQNVVLIFYHLSALTNN